MTCTHVVMLTSRPVLELGSAAGSTPVAHQVGVTMIRCFAVEIYHTAITSSLVHCYSIFVISCCPSRLVFSVNIKQHCHLPTGGYYMRTTETHVGKMSRQFLSPSFTLNTNTSCLTFHYFMKGPGKNELASYAALLVPVTYTNSPPAQFDKTIQLDDNGTQEIPPTNGRFLVWKVRTIPDNSWHNAQAEMSYRGEFRLLFEINGANFRGGLDAISVTPDSCPEFSKYVYCNAVTIVRCCCCP